jgi:multisubunit Na+/H+ antiporter MnhG subunit
MIAVAAIGSVGETMAPSTNAALQDMESTAAWATTATTVMVAITSPIASIPMGRAFARRSLREVKKAEA